MDGFIYFLLCRHLLNKQPVLGCKSFREKFREKFSRASLTHLLHNKPAVIALPPGSDLGRRLRPSPVLISVRLACSHQTYRRRRVILGRMLKRLSVTTNGKKIITQLSRRCHASEPALSRANLSGIDVLLMSRTSKQGPINLRRLLTQKLKREKKRRENLHHQARGT